MRLRLLSMVIVGVICLSFTQPAAAHVLVTDATGQVGAILHVMPDDDPIAGQAGDMFFDIQNTTGDVHGAQLSVTDAAGQATRVDVKAVANTVSANYTFPSQGVYTLRLNATLNGQERSFSYAQRVSRGDRAVAGATLHSAWAEPLLVAAIVGLLALTIIGVNHRKGIGRPGR